MDQKNAMFSEKGWLYEPELDVPRTRAFFDTVRIQRTLRVMEARARVMSLAEQNLAAFVNGKPQNVVNP